MATSFNSGKHNMGMILDPVFISQLTSEDWADTFCTYDDYNWDWSLFHTITQKLKWMRVFYPEIPRVYHIGKVPQVYKKD